MKIHRFKEAQRNLDILEDEMQMYSRQNYNTYLFNYYNSRINLLKFTNRLDEAGKWIDKAIAIKEVNNEPINEVFLLISKADYLFITGECKEAKKDIELLRMLKGYSLLEDEIKMHLDKFEIVLFNESQQFEKSKTALKEFKKRWRPYIKESENNEISDWIDIMGKIIKVVGDLKGNSIKGNISKFVKDFPTLNPGGNEIILHDLYLESKLKGETYYQLFINRMNNLSRD